MEDGHSCPSESAKTTHHNPKRERGTPPTPTTAPSGATVCFPDSVSRGFRPELSMTAPSGAKPRRQPAIQHQKTARPASFREKWMMNKRHAKHQSRTVVLNCSVGQLSTAKPRFNHFHLQAFASRCSTTSTNHANISRQMFDSVSHTRSFLPSGLESRFDLFQRHAEQMLSEWLEVLFGAVNVERSLHVFHGAARWQCRGR